MVDFLTTVVNETAWVLYEGSLFILLGFLVAGLLHELLPTDTIARHLGRDDLRSVTLAALFGAPIPLCSCGVLPAAAALRGKGASRSSLLSFLVSTPETGVDSIALTYALLGPVFAIVRPIVAVITALIAGLLSVMAPRDEKTASSAEVASSVSDHDHLHEHDSLGLQAGVVDHSWRARTGRILHYGFVSLLDDIAFWIVIGIGLTGVLAALLPDDFFSAMLGWDRGLAPMLAMILAGLPLYLCASASTPIAAALIAKGLSPGAALVFLLVGPATNAATVTVVGKLLGSRRLRIYLGTIIVVSLAAGLLLDAFGGQSVRTSALAAERPEAFGVYGWIKTAAAIVFVLLIALSYRRTRFAEGLHDIRDQLARLMVTVRAFRWRSLVSPPALAGIVLVVSMAAAPSVFLIVEPGQLGLIQRFGRIVETDLEPGLYVHLPPPFGRGTAVDVDLIRQVPVGFRLAADGQRVSQADQAFYLTGDENIIDIRSVVHYRVTDAARFALGVERVDALVAALARRELVALVSTTPIDTIYTTARRATEDEYRRALTAALADLSVGCEILDARLLDVHAPADVHDAFRDVASSLEDRERDIHVAHGYAAEVTTEAGGEAAEIVEVARGESAREVKMAGGNVAAFQDLATVHDQRPGVTETRLYLESLERALPKVRKYISGRRTKGADVDLWLGSGTPLPLALGAGSSPAGAEAASNEGGTPQN